MCVCVCVCVVVVVVVVVVVFGFFCFFSNAHTKCVQLICYQYEIESLQEPLGFLVKQ